MRDGLAMLSGQRIAIQGIVGQFSYKRYLSGKRTPTLILRSVMTLEGEPLTDHLWMPYTKAFQALPLAKGAVVALEGRVTPYTRGNGTQDYDLHYASKVRLVAPPPLPPLLPSPLVEIAAQVRGAVGMITTIAQALAALQQAGAVGDGRGAYGALCTARYQLDLLKGTLQTMQHAITAVERSS